MDADTLARVKTKMRASLIRRLDSNSGLAEVLTSYYVNYGDWRKLFTSLDDIDKVTADDVQRVARKYFIPNARTEVFNFQPAQASQKPALPEKNNEACDCHRPPGGRCGSGPAGAQGSHGSGRNSLLQRAEVSRHSSPSRYPMWQPSRCPTA